jgi:hypothetical protein
MLSVDFSFAQENRPQLMKDLKIVQQPTGYFDLSYTFHQCPLSFCLIGR